MLQRMVIVLVLPVALLLLAGCAAPGWQIATGEFTFGDKLDRSAHNVFLLNCKTGDTWHLMTDLSGIYYWKPMERRESGQQIQRAPAVSDTTKSP